MDGIVWLLMIKAVPTPGVRILLSNLYFPFGCLLTRYKNMKTLNKFGGTWFIYLI